MKQLLLTLKKVSLAGRGFSRLVKYWLEQL